MKEVALAEFSAWKHQNHLYTYLKQIPTLLHSFHSMQLSIINFLNSLELNTQADQICLECDL